MEKLIEHKHWLFAFVFAFVFVYLIQWTDMLGREFWDIDNYLFRIAYLARNGNEANLSVVQWIFEEPLWKWIVIFIGNVVDASHYRSALYFISFTALFFYGSFFFRRIEYYIIMVLFFNPLMVNLFIEQIRSALAFSLLLVAYDLSSRRATIFIMIMAFLIHASMIIFVAIYFMLYKLNQVVEARKYYLIVLGVSILMAFFMRYGLDIILQILGNRHAGYNEYAKGSSLAFSIFWFLLALVLSIFSNFENREERLTIAYSILILNFFFFTSLFGGFAQRYVSLSFPIVIIAISYLPKHFKQVTYVVLFAYSLLMFRYWFYVS
jgi:hypothetical protein